MSFLPAKQAVIQRTPVVAVSSGRNQSFRPIENRRVGEEENTVLATTFSLKDHFARLCNRENDN